MPQRIRAGCDYIENVCNVNIRSLPQRIRAGCDDGKCVCNGIHRLCHSAFVRVATRGNFKVALAHKTLPQRIRAGCDVAHVLPPVLLRLCHSAFVRVATFIHVCPKFGGVLCHSAFVRVATRVGFAAVLPFTFATAHSCGLRPTEAYAQTTTGLCHSAFVRVATPPLSVLHCLLASLPQRIRAGCDGLAVELPCRYWLCHSAFVRVATVSRLCKRQTRCLCHSAFVRVATVYFVLREISLLFATAHSCGLRQHDWRDFLTMQTFATAHSCGLRRN